MNMSKHILERARNSLKNEKHWIKDLYYANDNTCMCLAGAIRNARGVIESNIESAIPVVDIFELLAKQIEKLYPNYYKRSCFNEGVVISFNDYVNTRHGMILEVIDSAIEELNATVSG